MNGVFSMENENNSLEKKKGNTLCLISLALQFIPFILAGIVYFIWFKTPDIETMDTSGFLTMMIYLVQGSYIGSWALVIIARVKHKKCVFAKVLMWVYIALIALLITVGIAIYAWAALTCSGMPG